MRTYIFLFALLSLTSVFAQKSGKPTPSKSKGSLPNMQGRNFVGKPYYIENISQLNGNYLSGQLLSVSIYGGRFLTKDMAVGAGFKSTQSVVNMIKSPTTTVGSFYGFGRQYFPLAGSPVKLFGQAEIAYNIGNIPGLTGQGTGASTTDVQNTLSLGASPGVTYYFTSRFGVDAFVSGLKVNVSNIKSTQGLINTVLPALGRSGVGVAANVYF